MAFAEKPKAPPAPTLSRLGASALVETIDGPVEIVNLAGKAMPVLTRLADGSLGFRMMREVRMVEEEAQQVVLTNTDGQRVQVGVDHVFVDVTGKEIRAGSLVAGNRLEPSWPYRHDYVVPDTPEYQPQVRGRTWSRAVTIAGVEPATAGQVFGMAVNQTKTYFLTFGSLSRAQE